MGTACRVVVDSFGDLDYELLTSKRLPADRTMCQYYHNKYARKSFVQVLRDKSQTGVYTACKTKAIDDHSHRICACWPDKAVQAQIEKTDRDRNWLVEADRRFKLAKERDRKATLKAAEEARNRKKEEEAIKRQHREEEALKKRQKQEEEEVKRKKREEEARKKREEEARNRKKEEEA